MAVVAALHVSWRATFLLQNTCLEVFTLQKTLADSSLFNRTRAILYWKVALQEQDWTPLALKQCR